ncbi:MAG: type I-E CRISPR-associated protein Cse1/CasA, partial [Anaerolineales bacterium]
GLRLKKDSVLDPLKSYRIARNAPPAARGFSSSRALWRDSVALFEFASDETGSAPENLKTLSQLAANGTVSRQTPFVCRATGLLTAAGQARNIALWRCERLPIPAEYLVCEEAVERLRIAIRLAEDVGSALYKARDLFVWQMRIKPAEQRSMDEILRDKEFAKATATKGNTRNKALDGVPMTEPYWWQLDEEFPPMMVRLAPDEEGKALQAWRAALQQAAQSAFRQTIAGITQSGRVIRAAARTEQWLDLQLNRILAID